MGPTQNRARPPVLIDWCIRSHVLTKAYTDFGLHCRREGLNGEIHLNVWWSADRITYLFVPFFRMKRTMRPALGLGPVDLKTGFDIECHNGSRYPDDVDDPYDVALHLGVTPIEILAAKLGR